MRPRGRMGFTLIELLVVLAILVILFALLFAPMIASLDMVTLGQQRVTMQNTVRGSMEEMRRELANAMYVYPTPGIALKGGDGLLGTADDVRIPNYSEIVLVSPARTAAGSLTEPVEPRSDAAGDIIATRLRIALLDESQPYSEANPFVLLREEGYYTRSEDAVSVTWGFTNIGGAGDPVRNVLSPRSGYDFPVAQSVCTSDGEVYEGYAESCPKDGSSMMYLHDNLQFRPERILGEMLEGSANQTIYQARHAAWAGFFNPGNVELDDLDATVAGAQPARLGASELDPRIVLINPTDMSVQRDSFAGPSVVNQILTWNSESGTVQVGATTGRWISVPAPNANVTPGQYYPINIQDTRPDVGGATATDTYDDDGAIGAARAWDLVPIYPSLGTLTCTVHGGSYDPNSYNVGDPCPTADGGTLISTAQPGDPATPIAYRIDPTRAGTQPPAKIVPQSVRVIIWGVDAAGTPYQATYSETTITDQSQIGPRQFSVVLSDFNQRAEVRFSELQPPGPRMLTDAGITLDYFGIYIEYYFRRNYDPTTPQNDFVIRADYSTNQVMNIELALQRYVEPEPSSGNPDILVLPADITPDRVSLSDKINIRNLGR